MLVPGRPTSDTRQITDTLQITDAAIYTSEAAFAVILILSTLSVIVYVQPASTQESTDDLRILSDDLLNILQYRGNLPGHPDLSGVMSSQADWNARSPALEADVRTMLPPGDRFYLSTPYGDIGDLPPGNAPKHIRAFEAFAADENTIVECTLILWRVQG